MYERVCPKFIHIEYIFTYIGVSTYKGNYGFQVIKKENPTSLYSVNLLESLENLVTSFFVLVQDPCTTS